MHHQVSVIGLGVMGQRMLSSMASHERFTVVCAFDPDAGARERTAAAYPAVRIASSAAEAIAEPEAGAVYVACPPAAHREHVLGAVDAGKAVYCEKPLAVSLTEGEELVARAEEAGVVDIVNFSLASAAAVREVEERLAAGARAGLTGVDVRIHFSRWPREWQVNAAGWLSGRAQGGFTREVLSHWIYLAERLLGPAMLLGATVRYPGGEAAETHVLAQLEAGGVPVSVAGSVGGAGPDLVECTLWGERESLRIHDWNRLRVSDGGEWGDLQTEIADPRTLGYRLQLDNAGAAIAGETHSMPRFRDALSVQRIVEAILLAG